VCGGIGLWTFFRFEAFHQHLGLVSYQRGGGLKFFRHGHIGEHRAVDDFVDDFRGEVDTHLNSGLDRRGRG
jgi:hypothetical protein